MRWALPVIAAAVTFGLGVAGAPPAAGIGALPMRLEAMPPACGPAPAANRREPALLWAGLVLGTPDNPLATAWRGIVDTSKRREVPAPC